MINNTDYGLKLESVEYIEVINNTIVDNSEYGITIYSGLYLNIANNTVKENRGGINGVVFSWSDITYNLFENNYRYGVGINHADFINIHHNSFINNSIDIFLSGKSQAYDGEPKNNL